MSVNAYEGFNELTNELIELMNNVENTVDILEDGAKEFVNDLMKLPKPFSKISSSGYTHLIDSFSYQKNGDEIEVGWGKYYGRMVEEGTNKSSAQPHLVPTFERNKEKYYKNMINKIIN